MDIADVLADPRIESHCPSVPDRRVVACHYAEPDTLPGDAADISYQITPLGAGRFDAQLTRIRLDDLTLQLGRVSPCMGFVTLTSGMAVLLVPRENADSLVLNSADSDALVLGTLDGGTEFARTNPRPSGHAALILPPDLAASALEPPLRTGRLARGHCTLWRAGPLALGRAEALFRAVEEITNREPETFDGEQPRHALRDAVLDVARDLVSGSVGEPAVRMPQSARSRRRIALRSDEYLRVHCDRPIYTSELCDTLAVSESALTAAFRSVFRVSPHRYLKLRRLAMVRAALLAPTGLRPMVKAVALSHGFWHLGQFARDYRSTYGESPSDTLARAMA